MRSMLKLMSELLDSAKAMNQNIADVESNIWDGFKQFCELMMGR